MKSKTLSPHGRSSRPEPSRDTGATAREHYRREKARRSGDPRPDSELMEAAKREYQALLAEQAAKGKGGRPKKQATKPTADTEVEDEETDLDEE